MAEIYVITGAPCTGKTTVLHELEKEGYKILGECTREAAEIAGNWSESGKPERFDRIIFELRKKQIEEAKSKEGVFFSDRGIGDGIAFFKIKGGKEVPKDMAEYSKSVSYEKVFVFDLLGFYELGENRKSPQEKQESIQKEIIKVYGEMDCEIVLVPKLSVEERINFVLGKI